MKIQVIIGTTRKGRFSEKPAAWIAEEAKKIEGAEIEVVDLRDYPMPFYEEEQSPKALQGEYPNPISKKFAEKISEADAYIIVTAEYNHGYPAVLKNAFDYAYFPWNNKPVGFVSYGSAGGTRSVEQLRMVAIELQMTPIEASIAMYWPMIAAGRKTPIEKVAEVFAPLAREKDAFFEQLIWWTKALKAARGEKKS